MNFYVITAVIVLCALFLTLRIITVLKVSKGEYFSFFVRQLGFFPAEPINTDHLTESTRRKITRLVIISEFIEFIGVVLLLFLPSSNFLLKLFLVFIFFWLIPYPYFKKRLYRYLNL